MNTRWLSPVAVWLYLCALSVLSVAQLEQHWSRWIVPLLVVVIAALKAQLIIRAYMEAGRARALWRYLYNAWTFAAAATIGIGYLLSLR
jgi:Prokaryotic Cytochrome C oxidase subunit IV